MTTRAIVPNGDGEGSLGTFTAKWGAVYSSDPASGENSGQVPTTAWVQKLLADALANQKVAYEQAISTAISAAKTQAKLDAHPVGSYYWSNDSTSPATLFGGTWEALPAGYTLIAQGSGTDEYGSFTYTAGQKYGERKHPLTTDEFPKFTPKFDGGGNAFVANNTKHNDTSDGFGIDNAGGLWAGVPKTIAAPFNPIGNNAPHNNIPPVIASYGWKRTA